MCRQDRGNFETPDVPSIGVRRRTTTSVTDIPQYKVKIAILPAHDRFASGHSVKSLQSLSRADLHGALQYVLPCCGN